MLMHLYLTLTERLDGGDIVELQSSYHRLHVKDLAAHTLHQHREKVGVAEVQRTLRKKYIHKGAE